jgi:hypothetical protein
VACRIHNGLHPYVYELLCSIKDGSHLFPSIFLFYEK